MRGQVIYIYAYDIANEIHLAKAQELLKEPAKYLEPLSDKTIPRDFPFYKPLLCQKPPLIVASGNSNLKIYPEVKIFSFGAFSISLGLEFEADTLSQLLPYHSLKLGLDKTIDHIADEICEEIRRAISPALVKVTEKISSPEAYTIFYLKEIDQPNGLAQDWLSKHEREIAGLLTEESQFEHLSRDEIEETVRYHYSYSSRDLLVVDWNSALVVDPDKPSEVLYILEVSNLQLTELRHYDQFLGKFLDESYDDIEAYSRDTLHLRAPNRILRKLREIKIDLTKMSDELSNTTKFFGDWHLARLYMGCKERFHLKEWEDSVEGMLHTLDDLYHLVSSDINNRRLILLEVAIVLLFVVDILLLFVL
jgi:hypothetical protein